MAMTYNQAKQLMDVSFIYYDVPVTYNPTQEHFMILDGIKIVLGFSSAEISLVQYQLV